MPLYPSPLCPGAPVPTEWKRLYVDRTTPKTEDIYSNENHVKYTPKHRMNVQY